MMIGWQSPPEVHIDTEMAWMLRAAFAQELPGPLPGDPNRALALARTFEISGRVAARCVRADPLCCGAIGAELREDFELNLAVEAQLGQAIRRVAEIAEGHRVPAIALKYAALKLSGSIKAGTRVAADLDILLSPESVERVWRALLREGFVRVGSRPHAHQLEAVVDSFGAVVELHTHIPEVYVVAGHFATAHELIEAGLVTPCERTSLLVARPPLLAAHAIAHGLIQNRSTPQSYSMLRMCADLMDLRAVHGLDLGSCARYLAADVGELVGVAEHLCAALEQGRFTGPGFDGTTEQSLLWHCLAARLDAEYSRRLRAAGVVEKIRARNELASLVRYVFGALFPPQVELEAIYGPSRSITASVRRRLLRPLDVSLRAVGRRPRRL